MITDYDRVSEKAPHLLTTLSEAESGFASNKKVAMLTIFTGQKDTTIDVSFTYQVLDDSSCRREFFFENSLCMA